MYSEHLIAILVRHAATHYDTGAELDAELGRPVVQIGRIVGPDIGSNPSDGHLSWFTQKVGTKVAVGTRAAIHILPGKRVGVGLGPRRGVIESTGDHLALVRNPEPGRYLGAYTIPTIQYGGLV